MTASVGDGSLFVRHVFEEASWYHTVRRRDEPWRDFARYLAGLGASQAIPAHPEFLVVSGARGVTAELLEACWKRWGEDMEEPVGRLLVELPLPLLRTLKAAHDDLSLWADAVFEAEGDNPLALLHEAWTFRSAPRILPRLIARHRTKQDRDPVGMALRAEQAHLERKEARMSAFRDPIKKACEPVYRAARPAPTRFAAGMADLRAQSEFTHAVERHVRIFGTLPSGTFLHHGTRYEFPRTGADRSDTFQE